MHELITPVAKARTKTEEIVMFLKSNIAVLIGRSLTLQIDAVVIQCDSL